MLKNNYNFNPISNNDIDEWIFDTMERIISDR